MRWVLVAGAYYGNKKPRARTAVHAHGHQEGCGAVRRWVLVVLVGGQVAADGEEGGRPVAARVVHAGKRLGSRPGEVKGREAWRIKPSEKRLERYCNEDERGQVHPLAGLVGYSE